MAEALPELGRDALAAVGRVLAAVTGAGFELQPILDRIAAEAAALCNAQIGFVFMLEGELIHFVAATGGSPAHWDYERAHPFPITRDTVAGRVFLANGPVHIPDVAADSEYTWEGQSIDAYRTLLGVPIRTDDGLIGAFGLARMTVSPFAAAEIELVGLFADQAAIAIRLARLLAAGSEAQDRERSFGQVLASVARATFDLPSVLQTIIEQSARLCGADTGNIAVREGDAFRIVAFTGFTEDYLLVARTKVYLPGRGSVIARVLLDRSVVQATDILTDPDYSLVDLQKLGGFRSVLGVPIWHSGELIGVIATGRNEVRAFTDREVSLLETFADQVAIALNLARLLTETNEALERETAVGQVLQSISRSTFDLDAVLQTVIDSAVRLAHADQGNITREEGGVFRARAFSSDVPEAFRRIISAVDFVPERGTVMGRALLERGPVQVLDVPADPEYRLLDAQRAIGLRTMLAAPLLRDGAPIGTLAVWRREVRAFTASEIAVLATFADQAAIAIANVRLFETVERQRTELARFAPQVAGLLSSPEGEQLLAGHRREISALFCDLRGFTAFAEVAEPEELFSVLREYHAAVGAIVVANGGTVEHFAGDGLMVFFNDPTLLPYHQLAAVRTACEMREQFGPLSATWRKRGYELGLGIGIASGYATLGRIGFEGRHDYAAIGNSVILASRLSSAAGPGQILINQRVFAAVEDAVEVEEVEALQLKGVSHPVAAYSVLSVRAID
jgi:GAF domain-containing protein